MARTEPADLLRAAMQNLRIPIGTDIDATDVDATNVAEARTQLEDRRQQIVDLSETLAATRRRLEASQMEQDAAHGFTPAAAEPSRAADTRARGGAIGRAFGTVRTVYETSVKNMHAVEAATVGLDQLTGEELKEHIGRMRKLLRATNTQQDRLNQLAKLARSGSARFGGPGELLHMASSPPGEAHSGQARTWRDPSTIVAGVLGDEPAPETQRGPGQHGRRPAPTDPAPRGLAASRLGRHAIDNADARHRLDQLARSLEVEESSAIGPTCFGPRIREEPFPKGFVLPRDTPSTTGP